MSWPLYFLSSGIVTQELNSVLWNVCIFTIMAIRCKMRTCVCGRPEKVQKFFLPPNYVQSMRTVSHGAKIVSGMEPAEPAVLITIVPFSSRRLIIGRRSKGPIELRCAWDLLTRRNTKLFLPLKHHGRYCYRDVNFSRCNRKSNSFARDNIYILPSSWWARFITYFIFFTSIVACRKDAFLSGFFLSCLTQESHFAYALVDL